MPHNSIPLEYFREAWEDADHPMACVDPDNRFVMVNSAFERLLGYSSAELNGKPWMEITVQRDVGGDLASVEAVIEGRIDTYTLEKDYLHKRGRAIPVVLTVRRFPRASHLPLLYFSVEAPLSTITRPEMVSLERDLRAEIAKLSKSFDSRLKDGVHVNMGDQDTIGGDKVGRDKNSDAAIKVVAGALVAISISVAWLFYYVASVANREAPQPPNITKDSHE